MEVSKKIFTGALDFDSEDRLVVSEDSRFRLNVRAGSAEDDDIGAITNVLGNTLVTFALPGGENRTVGSLEDRRFNTNIYLVWNENSSHGIYQYFPQTNTITTIKIDPLFNFQKDNLITGIRLIDGKYLAWNDDYNEPSLLDIEKAKINQYPLPFKRQYIDRIPYAPPCPPTVVYDTDNAIKTNNLKGKLFQFKYKNVYFDNRESAWSPISKLPLPVGEIYNSTSIPLLQNNVIKVTLDTGDAIVTKIKIAVREGNLGDFFLVTSLDKSELLLQNNTTHVFNFYNDGIYTGINLTDSNSLFDNVPLKAKSLELIDGNRIADGDVLNGFDLVPIKVTLAPIYNDVPASTTSVNDFTVTIDGALKRFAVFKVNTLIANATYKMDFSVKVYERFTHLPPTDTKTISYTFTTNSTSTKTDIVNYFKNKVLSDLALGVSSPFWSSVFNYMVIDPWNVTIFNGDQLFLYVQPLPGNYTVIPVPQQRTIIFDSAATSTTDVTNTSVRSFKAGALHKFGIVYYDTPNRSGTVNRSKECEVFVDWYSERNKRGSVDMKMSISHTPPIWATHYQILYTKNQSIGSFIHFTTDSVVVSGNFQEISLANIVTYSTANPNSILAYGWAKGDRIRLIRGASGAFFTSNYDTEIVSYDSGTNKIKIANLGLSDMGAGMLFEIYTPKKNIEEVVFREIGECYEIGDAGLSTRYHKGSDRDQSTTPFNFTATDIGITTFGQNPIMNIPFGTLTSAQVSTNDYIQINGTIYNGLFRVIGRNTSSGFILGITIDAPILGQETNISCSIFASARVLMTNEGDVYYKSRAMANVPTGTTYFVEDANFSDYYVSDYCNIGRPNIYDPNAKQQRRPATIYYSQPYIADTNINGLGTVYDLNFEEYDKNFGSIQRLISQDKSILVFQQLKVGRVPVNQFQINDTQGQQVMGATEEILSKTIQYYQGEFGIGFHPEAYAQYGNRKYFADVQRGAVLRLSNDGLSPISEYKAHNYFTDRFRDILKRQKKTNIYGVYDVKFGEYILSLEKKDTPIPIPFITTYQGYWIIRIDNSLYGATDKLEVEYIKNGELQFVVLDVIDSVMYSNTLRQYRCAPTETSVPPDIKLQVWTRETIAFNEVQNRWSTFYSYQSEFMSGSNIDIVSWKNGQLWKHNTNSVYNNFYGAQYDSQIEVIHNEAPGTNKVYDSIETDSSDAWAMELVNQYGQKTSLAETDYEVIENVFWGAFKKDENTQNVINPIIEGDDIRCHSAKIKLTNKKTTFTKLFAMGIKAGISMNTTV